MTGLNKTPLKRGSKSADKTDGLYPEVLTKDRFTSGFTLLELIIAMAIIAIIGGTIWGNFFPSMTKGKDSRRKQDLSSVAKALELYYYDNRAYPTAMPVWGTQFVNPGNSTVVYMQKLPTDPNYPGATYCYTTDSGGSYFKLYANLENLNDPMLIPTITCSGAHYNYGIASPNASP